ncbi:MAG: protease modulator HflC [Gammaproteobacteria bacterium]|jgi:membrane protease subunit HflC|nr:protease modulator HflC [Gammaproteobacteria bacterium]
MLKNITILLVAAALLVAMSSLFIVDERQVAIKFRLGEIVQADYAPGLHFKAPWPINNVVKFDKRVMTLDTRPERFLTGEKKNVEVDFFVKWRIKNTAKYYTSFMGDERQAGLRLLQIVNNGLQLEFDQRTIKQVVSDQRSEMMSNLTLMANNEVAQFGIEIVDVRIKRIELPAEVSNSVYQRMRAERERIAKEHRAQGQEAAKGIQAIADRERTVILAEAGRDAEILRGEGDARATDIYATAYEKNQQFYEFYRSMNAYREAFANQQDVLVLEPDSEFFKYFSDYSVK